MMAPPRTDPSLKISPSEGNIFEDFQGAYDTLSSGDGASPFSSWYPIALLLTRSFCVLFLAACSPYTVALSPSPFGGPPELPETWHFSPLPTRTGDFSRARLKSPSCRSRGSKDPHFTASIPVRERRPSLTTSAGVGSVWTGFLPGVLLQASLLDASTTTRTGLGRSPPLEDGPQHYFFPRDARERWNCHVGSRSLSLVITAFFPEDLRFTLF